MSAPVAQMVISTMKIIMGEDGTNDGKDMKLMNLLYTMHACLSTCLVEYTVLSQIMAGLV